MKSNHEIHEIHEREPALSPRLRRAKAFVYFVYFVVPTLRRWRAAESGSRLGLAAVRDDSLRGHFGSGSPSTRLATMFRLISLVPPSIELAFERSHMRTAAFSASL